jgi:hypothetical protein
MDSHARAGTKGQLGALDPNIKADTSGYKSTASVGASNQSLISSAMVWDLHNNFFFSQRDNRATSQILEGPT